jgi:DNA polymerase-3 subunit beta
MQFVCDKNTILREITIASDIISSRNALSILSNVLLEIEDDHLRIKATDLKVSFETVLPVEVITPGSTTVFCDKFSSILRSLPDGEVEFEQQEARLVIRPKDKKIDFQLKSIASDRFPELQQISEDKYFRVNQKDIIEMITQTIFAVSEDETRYYMNGVFFEKQDSSLVMVATDGRRLSYIKKECEEAIPDFEGVIIPPKVLGLIKKLASGEGELSIAVSEKSIFVSFDNLKLASNLIEGQFPNYSRVIPQEQEHSITVEKAPFLEALKRVSLLVEQKSRRVYLSLMDDVLTLSSEESEIGIAKEELPCDYKGEDANIALNYLYLEDPLKVIEEEEVNIRFTEVNKAITLQPIPQGDYFHIVMPMQLD